MKDNYNDFKVGDTYTFKKQYSKKDFEAFSNISGDTNPLHFNDEYAKQTKYDSTIVPLHLAASPLSAIAGVIFPGHLSLYLSHELKAINPIPYDTELTYSAKIIEKNSRERVLKIRTLVFRDEVIFIEAIQNIKVREDLVPTSLIPNPPVKSGFVTNENAILITGALGEIGQRIALNLAKKGYKLILCVRTVNDKALRLASKLEVYNTIFEFLEVDLENIEYEKIINLQLNIGTIIHAASPPVFSSLSKHMAVSFEALQTFFNAFKYQWLCQQSGRIIFISSSATHFHPQGWENYIVGKSATENYLKGIQKNYSSYGIGVNILSPGLVDTKFSSELGLDLSRALLPEQVAEEAVLITESPDNFYTWLEDDYKKVGTVGFIEDKSNIATVAHQNLHESSVDGDLTDKLKTFFIKFFNLSGSTDWNNIGINLLPGWDSLRHIELLIGIESAFNVTITTEEIEQTRTFMTINKLLKNK